MIKNVFILLVASALMVGCVSNSAITRITAKNATIVGLTATDASYEDANKVRSIAVTTGAFVETGELDTAVIEKEVLRILLDEFGNEKAAVYGSIVSDITAVIVEQLKDSPSLNFKEDVKILIVAATQGVEEGAIIYMQATGTGEVTSLRVVESSNNFRVVYEENL